MDLEFPFSRKEREEVGQPEWCLDWTVKIPTSGKTGQ